MSMCATKTLGTCLRVARREAGLVSIMDAARETSRSPESIGRHERGEVNLHPVDILQYAQAYSSPDLLLRYCNECPIYRTLNEKGTQDRDLPEGALKVSFRLHQAARQAEILEGIAEDGMIDQSEVNQFNSVIDFLQEISAATRDLILYAMSAGIIIPDGMKKDRTAGTVPARASIAR